MLKKTTTMGKWNKKSVPEHLSYLKQLKTKRPKLLKLTIDFWEEKLKEILKR